MKRMNLLPVILIFLLTSCGQQGALYLPTKPNEIEKPKPITPVAAMETVKSGEVNKK